MVEIIWTEGTENGRLSIYSVEQPWKVMSIAIAGQPPRLALVVSEPLQQEHFDEILGYPSLQILVTRT